MHMVDVDLLSNEICRNRVLGAESQIDIASDIICGKAREENNMCQADVGGPLACYDGHGAYHIAGIYSQDTGCLPTNQVCALHYYPQPLSTSINRLTHGLFWNVRTNMSHRCTLSG